MPSTDILSTEGPANDITMCEGRDCPAKDRCYRHTATPDKYWQSWFSDPPYDPKTMGNDPITSCPYFWDNSEEKRRKK